MTTATATPDLGATMAQLQTVLGQLQPQLNAAGATAWNVAPGGMPAIASVAIPIKLNTPAGNIRVYLGFPGEVAGSPEQIQGLLQQLASMGLPLDTYQPKSWGNGGGGGWNQGGGWNGNGGGYRRGGRW